MLHSNRMVGDIMEKKVLVVDDEKSIADAIAYALTREGYQVKTASNGSEALELVKVFQPKVLILDVMMPVLNGFDVCRQLENKDSLGIILLTAKADIIDKVLGLELGADDYLTKPFDMRELLARVHSLFRRVNKSREVLSIIAIGDLRVLLDQHVVTLDGSQLDLTPKEFELLVHLLSNPQRVYSRDELLDLVWGMDYIGGTRTVDIHVQRLRKKLGHPYQQLIQTVHGYGYKGIGALHEI